MHTRLLASALARKGRLIVFLFTLALLVPTCLRAQGNFLPGVNYPVAGNVGIAVGDVNGDKKLDIVVAELGTQVGVLLGNGDGTFQPETTINVPLSNCDTVAVALGDFNGDGALDLAVLCQTIVSGVFPNAGAIEIYLNNGDGTFGTPVEYPIDGANPSQILAADFRNNGKVDLVVLNAGSPPLATNQVGPSVTVLLGNGDGTFGTPANYGLPSGTAATSIVTGDLNGDGRPDVAIATGTSSGGAITVFLTNADGALGTGTNWVTTTTAVCAQLCANPTAVAIVDLNNDGKPDLLADVGIGEGLVALLGNGDGTFQTALPSDLAADPPGYSSATSGPLRGTSFFAAGDFNSDGKLDIAEAMLLETSQYYNLAIYFGNGDGTFQSPSYLVEGGPNGSSAGPIFSADLNGDGYPDLIFGISSAGVPSAKFVTVVMNCALRCTATSLSSAVTTSNFNQPVSLTATVTPLSSKVTGTPTGMVTFLDAITLPATNLGTVSLTSGSATFTSSTLSVGSHSITASYQGDQNFTLSSSSAFSLTVRPAPTATLIGSSPNPSSSGQSVSFTATVAPSTSGVPTGSVTFADNGAQSASVALDATGSASFSLASLTSGTHAITWSYSGDNNFGPSTSAPLTQIVGTSSSSLAIAASATSATVGAGQSTSFMLAITPLTGFNTSNPISLSCSGLPALASCTFTPSTLNTKGNVVTTMLSITTTGPHSGSAALQPFGTRMLAAASLLIAGFVFLSFPRKRGRFAALLNLLPLASLVILLAAACGGGSSMTTSQPTTTPAGTYTVAVTATAGSSTQTQNLSLTVTP